MNLLPFLSAISKPCALSCSPFPLPLAAFFLLALTKPEEAASSMKETVPALLLLAGGHGFGSCPSSTPLQISPSNLSPTVPQATLVYRSVLAIQ